MTHNNLRFNVAVALRILAAGLIFSSCHFNGGKEGAPRPNIVLILADDMGYSDIGCFGSGIETPNIDRLAKEGLAFTQFYNAGRCCPSRASLLTGMYSHRAGIGHMVETLDHPGYRGFLNEHCVTLAEALRLAGYATYMSGKWHVGTEEEHWPLQRGFDKFYGSNTSQGHYFRVYEGRKLLYDNKEITPPADWYATDAFTDSAIAFMQRHEMKKKDKPFFLYVPYTAPHWPIQALPEDFRKYASRYNGGYDSVRQQRYLKMKNLSIIKDTWQLSPLDPDVPSWDSVNRRDEARKMAVYAAMIDRLDQGIGRILKEIHNLGVEDNTMVIFLSDNGGCAEEIHRSVPGSVIGDPDSYESIGLPWADVSNTPFRKYKSWTHEGGISTPLIVRYPALIKGGSTTNEVGHIIDFMPTFLELAGGEYPEKYKGNNIYPMDGQSLVPIFRSGKREGHPALFWEHEGKRAVRQGDWKLVSGSGGDWELYNIPDDRTEMHDLSAQHPEKVKELRELYENWARESNVLPWSEVQAMRGRR